MPGRLYQFLRKLKMNLSDFPPHLTKVTVIPVEFSAETGGRFEIHHGQRRVGEIDGSSVGNVARDIAHAINHARDIGFQQGLASVRAALGVK
jgi:hypothetical protein